MINTNRNFVNNIDLNEENSLPHLIEQMDPNCKGELNPIEFMKTHLQTNGKLSILNLNCQCINSKFDKIKLFLECINNNAMPVSVITLQPGKKWVKYYVKI